MAQLTCEHLSLGYEGKPVIEDLSFSVEPGEYLCVIGENGSGKSQDPFCRHLYPTGSLGRHCTVSFLLDDPYLNQKLQCL